MCTQGLAHNKQAGRSAAPNSAIQLDTSLLIQEVVGGANAHNFLCGEM